MLLFLSPKARSRPPFEVSCVSTCSLPASSPGVPQTLVKEAVASAFPCTNSFIEGTAWATLLNSNWFRATVAERE